MAVGTVSATITAVAVTASVPVTVTYELTALGRSLHVVIAQLKAWAESHMDDVLEARAPMMRSHDVLVRAVAALSVRALLAAG